MANTSATGGYLGPAVASPPLEDADLDAVFQAYAKSITGLEGKYVRPRWQPTVPIVPEVTVNWCAIGVTRTISGDFPSIEHNGAGEGLDVYTRHQEIEVLASLYGPRGMQYAERLRDGVYVPQNSEVIAPLGISLIEAMDVIAVPELVNQHWVRRYDLMIRFRRAVRRTYAVLNILGAEIVTESDTGPGGTVTVP